MSLFRPLFVAFSLALSAGIVPCAAAGLDLRLQEQAGATTTVAGRPIDIGLIREFYAARGFKPAWAGAARARGDALLAAVRSIAPGEGLRAQSYTLPDAPLSDDDRDLLVSDALARFAHDLAVGRVAPSRLVGGMPEVRPSFSATASLRDLAAGQDLAAVLSPVQPAYAGYHRLKLAMARYQGLVAAGGWPNIADGPSIKPGMTDPRLAQVRQRLIVTGELAAGQDKGTTLDDALVVAVKKFQARHGIDPDGAIGRQTLLAMNITAEERLRQVVANMERWRWLPHKLEDTHIAVNLPAAHLELVRGGHIDMAMRVVVGDVGHQTPTMATMMTSVVVNPTWTVPPTIATKEILPKLRKDPSYLVANNMRILDAFDNDFEKAQGLGIDWSQYSRFPYRLRQKPGADNALGQIKFNLDNGDDIYLHDTPRRQYFGRIFRALSHGCVRLERPIDLARAVLSPQTGEKLDEWAADDTTRTLKLDHPLRVYLMYMTAWADEDGTVHFAEDLYGHDNRLKAALKRRQAAIAPATTQGSKS